jgi:hypothetical protein
MTKFPLLWNRFFVEFDMVVEIVARETTLHEILTGWASNEKTLEFQGDENNEDPCRILARGFVACERGNDGGPNPDHPNPFSRSLHADVFD